MLTWNFIGVQLRTVRGQLASAMSASAAAEGRVRQLSSQVSVRDAALAKMREEHDAVVSSLKQVISCDFPSCYLTWSTSPPVPLLQVVLWTRAL